MVENLIEIEGKESLEILIYIIIALIIIFVLIGLILKIKFAWF